MKKPKISFRVFGNSGPLTLSWFDGPKGDAVEANNTIGVGFFSKEGTLLCVEFDDVNEKNDHQVLEFDRYRVEVTVVKSKVSCAFKEIESKKKTSKKKVA